MPTIITESIIEEKGLKILNELGYTLLYGPDISEGGKHEERKYPEVILAGRLRQALERINPKIPKEGIIEAIRKVQRSESQNLLNNNQQFHNFLVNGVEVEYKKDGKIKGDKVWLIDFEKVKNNEFLAVNQFTIVENNHNRRPDILIFINGLPLALFELKNPADQDATMSNAFKQVETYKVEIPSLFRYNEIIVLSDGLETHAGTLTSGVERFTAWKTIDGEKPKKAMIELEILISGMFKKETLLDFIKNFIVFQKEKDNKTHTIKLSKKMAAYHQFNATNHALASTIQAIKKDKRAGVVWHTQGSGKSLTMVFYAGKIILAYPFSCLGFL